MRRSLLLLTKPRIRHPRIQQLKAVTLTLLYTSMPSLAGISLVWGSASLHPATAVAQTLPKLPPTAPPIAPTPVLPLPATPRSEPEPPKNPTTLQLLEQAKQRLRERGELPSENSLQNPSPVQGQPVPPDAQIPVTPPQDPFVLYRLGPGDTIGLVVQRFPDLNFVGPINPEGNVILPLLGSVSLAGLTLEEAQSKIRDGLNRYLVDPIVRVTLSSQRPIQVTIIGEVFEPGFYFLSVRGQALPRVSTALFVAGGATVNADLRSIRIRRSLADGTIIEKTIDLFTPLKNGGTLPDLSLQDRDAVVVSRLPTKPDPEYDSVLAGRSTLAQPFIRVRVLSYATGGITTLRLERGSSFVDALTAIGPNPDNADLGNIGLVRFDAEQGKAISRQIDGGNALRGDPTHNVALQDNDVIIVGRNLVGRITYALNVFTQPFRDVLGFLLFFDSLSNSAGNIFGPGTNRR